MVCGDEVVLATNTSSIPVTSLASAAAQARERRRHALLQSASPDAAAGGDSRASRPDEAVARARQVGEAMGKEVIVAADGPGFLVNRCGRPFNGEGLRLLQERVATHEQIDRICRLGGGFRMGPFELMDLVGIDVGFEVAKSFEELSFGEPRWRPNPIQARMVAAGRLGPKDRPRLLRVRRGRLVPGGRSRAAGSRRRRRHVPDRSRRRPRGGQASRARAAGGIRAPRGRPERAGPRRAGAPGGVAPRRRAGGGPVRLQQPRGTRRARRGRLPPTPDAQLVELTRLPDDPGVRGHGRAGVLRAARLRDRVGGGRARARARPDREPARQRGGLRDRRGRGLGRRRGHRADARALPSARAGGVERGDRPRPRAGACSTACGTSAARSATAPRRCSAAPWRSGVRLRG